MKRLITVLLVVMLAACASGRNGIDDRKIETAVRSAISSALPTSPLAIEVRVEKAVVTLTGRAASEEDRRRIGDAADGVKGVRTVINNIQVE